MRDILGGGFNANQCRGETQSVESLFHWRGEATPLVSLKGFISTTLITMIGTIDDHDS